MLTPEGFFSTTCKRDDPDTIQVRARRREHLEELLKRVGEHCLLDDDGVIHENAGTDYQYRVYVPKRDFTEWMKIIGETIDYHNFKNKAWDTGLHDVDYINLLHDIWHLGYKALSEHNDEL